LMYSKNAIADPIAPRATRRATSCFHVMRQRISENFEQSSSGAAKNERWSAMTVAMGILGGIAGYPFGIRESVKAQS